MTKAIQKNEPAKTQTDTYPFWYAAWVANYIATFGKAYDENLLQSMKRWYPGFAVIGATKEELDAVTLRIIVGSEPMPVFPADHLDRIKIELHNIRSEKRKAEERQKVGSVREKPITREEWISNLNSIAAKGNDLAISLLKRA